LLLLLHLFVRPLLFNFQFQYSTVTGTSSVQLSTHKTAHICILACFNAAVLSQYTMALCYTSNRKFSTTEYLYT